MSGCYQSILSSYSRLLIGASLALLAVSLVGCNETVAEKAGPSRPVLVAIAHYKAEQPERSFVGTIRPRIEADMGFRLPGKVAKRLVEVGQTVDVGQPLATLDEVDLKLQAEQAEAEFRAATGVLAQAAPPSSAPRICAPGADHRCAVRSKAAPPPMRRARGSIAPSAGQSHQELASYATLVADSRGVVTATFDRAGSGRGRRPDGHSGRALCRKGSRGRDPGDAARPRQRRHGERDPVVRAEPEIRREAARDRTRGRSGHAYLSCEILAAGSR